MQYKIAGIFYTKPFIVRDAAGEVHAGRVPVRINVGSPSDFDGYEKKVTEIKWDEDLRQFFVFFEKGGMKTVPYLLDTEVSYIEETVKRR